MAVRNSYPELPEVNYQRTVLGMDTISDYIKSLNYPAGIKAAAYTIVRMESSNGKAGINGNYAGLQADSGKWSIDMNAVATTIQGENMTKNQRRFLVFDKWQDCIDALCNVVKARGLYVGGYLNHNGIKMQINSADDWAVAYYMDYVIGSTTGKIPDADRRDLMSMYNQGLRLFQITGA